MINDDQASAESLETMKVDFTPANCLSSSMEQTAAGAESKADKRVTDEG